MLLVETAPKAVQDLNWEMQGWALASHMWNGAGMNRALLRVLIRMALLSEADVAWIRQNASPPITADPRHAEKNFEDAIASGEVAEAEHAIRDLRTTLANGFKIIRDPKSSMEN